jgi:hypothetical protein
MQDVDPQNKDHSEVKNSDQLVINQQQQQQQMMGTPKPNEICNNYILPQESDIEYEPQDGEPQESDIEYGKNKKVYQKQEEIYRGTFGTKYMFKIKDSNNEQPEIAVKEAKNYPTKIAVKVGIPGEENS